MTEAMEGWIKFEGGACPVPPDTKVRYRTAFEVANPGIPISEDDNREASSIRWEWRNPPSTPDDNIVAYRVVDPA